MRKKMILLLITCLSIPFSKAEINTGNSVEWLCEDAGMIATGILQSHMKCSSGNNTYLCTFTTVEMLRGSTANPVTFIVSSFSEDSLKKYESQKTPLLVFLKESMKKIKCLKSESEWEVLESYNAMPALVNLDTPPKLLIAARGFTVLLNRETILTYCRMVLQKLAEYEVMGHSVFMNYLEIPYQTAAFSLLYSGSSCYLTVPHFMFPESKEKM